jgi:hypothetical protein
MLDGGQVADLEAQFFERTRPLYVDGRFVSRVTRENLRDGGVDEATITAMFDG